MRENQYSEDILRKETEKELIALKERVLLALSNDLG